MFSLNGLSSEEKKIGKSWQNEGDAVECVSPSLPRIHLYISLIVVYILFPIW